MGENLVPFKGYILRNVNFSRTHLDDSKVEPLHSDGTCLLGMERDRKCILCETVCVSKQEMDEHMRSMLHHRELEKLKGRDCGHECRVCGVTVVSLTEYASHISSSCHKQNVDKNPGGGELSQEYFDQDLVDLIQKRKDKIRKEKEAAAAKAANKEEKRRKKENFQQKLQEAKERYRLECVWQAPLQGHCHQFSWYQNQAQVDPHIKRGKGATWHAQAPPDLQKWASGDLTCEGMKQPGGGSSKTWGHDAFHRGQQNYLPWLSSGGSSHGLYGHNNINTTFRPRPQRNKGPPSFFQSPAGWFMQTPNQPQSFDRTTQQDPGARGAGSEHSSRPNGSNPVSDKGCRWSPYPATATHQTEAHPHAPEISKLKQEKTAETCAFVPRRCEKTGGHLRKVESAPRDESRVSGFHREASVSNQQADGKISSALRGGAQLKKAAGQAPSLPNPRSKAIPESTAAQKTGSQRLVSESSTAAKQKGSQRPVPKSSSASLQTRSRRPIPDSSAAAQQMESQRPVSESSSTTFQTGSQKAIPESSPDPQQMESQRPVSESSSTTFQTGSQKAIPESSPDPQQMKSQRPVPESSNATLPVGSQRPISESFIPSKQTGPQRPLLESSTAPQQMGSQRPVPEYSTTTLQVESQKPISEFSTAAWQKGSQRPISEHSTADRQTGSQRPIPHSSPAALQTGSKKSCARSSEGTNSEIPGHRKETRKFFNSAKPDTSDLAGPLESAAPPSDSSLQSLQVTTSVLDSLGPTGSVREEEEGVRDEAVESGQSSNPDAAGSAEAASNTPHSSKPYLPHVLKWDLSKHINSKNKAGGHEPNLNIARRVRNLSGSRKREADRDSGLKPTVRQLLNGSGSRRCVNWEQLYDELRKKQDKGKGMPRFGIEMVPNEQDYPRQEEEALLEGFDWDLVTDFFSQGPTRKRSVSESSLAPSTFSLLAPHSSEDPQQGAAAPPQQQRPAAHKQPDTLMSASVKVLQRSESAGGDSSSGTEQCDGQGSGKRRRPATDGQSAEASCVEHNSKRRKVKSKKERQQIDQLLSVSLREEELSRSLQTLDSDLIQARSVLEAAYMEVQRLILLKQQITAEMSMLRNTRIDLLKGMQGTSEEPLKIKEEKSDTPLDGSAAPTLHLPAGGASPPPPSLQSISVVIKAEPQSPVMVSQPGLEDRGAPFIPLQETAARPESSSENSSGCRDQAASSVLIQGTIHPSTIKLSPSCRGSGEGTAADCPSALNTPPHHPEQKSGARVRKLKKKKSLKKAAAGAKRPESSDSEGDEEACRPRWMRLRRRASAGSQSSSCSLPADDREGSRALRLMSPVINVQKVDPCLYKHDEQENPDSIESMEVSPACHTQPPASPPRPSIRGPEPQSLACSQVSSTSDMDLCKSSESDLPSFIVYAKNSSVLSDHGGDEGPTEGVFEGHQEAVNGLQIHDGLLYTCSSDRTVRVFDLVSRQCVAVMEGHASKVTCLLVSAAPSLPHRLYSGSSDQTIRSYSLKTRELEQQFILPDRVLCLHSCWELLYAGLANGSVVTFNLKTNKQMDVWDCHGPRGVSCLTTSQQGACRLLLVGSYDSSISVRDARSGLLIRMLLGHVKSVLCIQVVGDLVFSGSSDHCVRAHSISTGQLLQVYRGHSHAVTVVSILGGVMVTACLDKLVRVFDLQSQEQRQVYGGHRDMVLCMNVYKNMIYTGCYDGSVHAVRLNLSHSFTCRWQGCALAFGVMEHLQQHLISVHARASGGVQTVRCRWNDCEDVVCVRSSTQTLLLHMRKHAEEDMDVQP
ncbi:hypothetical protein OJAV_G00210690 [Oryzias javanicus]|uniref:C2H2-type domain-containing protein n=1 Tax=Oryzias javanicus TaxID=123683 RepID=A0A437C2E5_ORYJA|nr:hypothetical protein OJAV_G00210690 [Oryzias javanicus]